MAYLTTNKIADLLSVSVDNVLAWIHSGELKARNVAFAKDTRPRWRVAETELETFLESRSSVPPAPAPEPERTKKPKGPSRVYY